MSINDEITRLSTAKTNLAIAIQDKGVTMPQSELLSNYYNYVQQIPNGDFKGLIDGTITNLEIPEGITSIRRNAFQYCNSLTSVTIPNSVTSIGEAAFQYCPGLVSVTMPNSVTSIGGYAFRECTSLKNITISNSLTSISYWAFQYCSSLTSITIPNSVTEIGYGAFSDCTKLATVDFSTHTAVPTIPSSNIFNKTSSALVIKVPAALLDKWKAAMNWKYYADKIIGV